MRDQLLEYYERELRFIRRSAAQFAAKYPAIAGRLMLEPEKCEDPHVERIIEAFAMLSARVHLRLDDAFPELTDALLHVLYPHYTAPIPSMTIVQMELDPDQDAPAEGVLVDRHSILFSKPVDGVRCRFRTCFPATLWPVEVLSVKVASVERKDPACPVDAQGTIRLVLRTAGEVPFSELKIDKLRFFLNGESSVIHRLYEALFSEAKGMLVRAGSGRPVFLDADHIRPVGFDPSEGMFDYPHESFFGFRLLHEYFTFQDKFLFMELAGLGQVLPSVAKDRIEIEIMTENWITDLVDKLEPDNFAVGCTPAINLFPHRADPISLKQTRVEYQVIPDVHSPYSFEVHSLIDVSSTVPGKAEGKVFKPFYSLQHGDPDEDEPAFWHPLRQRSIRKDDPGTDLFLTLVDRDFKATDPAVDILHVNALCTNRDLPARLPFGDIRGDFQIEGHPEIMNIRCLRKPTPPIRTHLEEDTRWALISHLSLNYLSIAEMAGGGPESSEGKGLDAFREILSLYDFLDSAVTRKRVDGLKGIKSRRITRRLGGAGDGGFARGVEITLEFDEEKYAGTSVYLFASILERFLGHYASINSFVQTEARVQQREGVLKRWPPRAGRIRIL